MGAQVSQLGATYLLVSATVTTARAGRTDAVTMISHSRARPARSFVLLDFFDWFLVSCRKRAREMMKTAEKALEYTRANQGKHFIGDFLPKQEVRRCGISCS